MISQSSYDSLVKPRYIFQKTKTENHLKNKFIIIGSDTLFGKKNQESPLFIKSDYDSDILKLYRKLVFQNTNRNSQKRYFIKQWSTPIIVFIDKSLPNIISKKFQEFYSQLNIPNLNISFTSDIEQANYFIKTTSKDVNSYDENFEFDTVEEKQNSIYTGATYNLLNDYNNKFYGALLVISIKNNSNYEKKIRQLKQLFYTSLSLLYITNKVPNESLLSKKYKNLNHIDEFDLTLLRIHYHTIYDQPIDKYTFEKLTRLYNSKE